MAKPERLPVVLQVLLSQAHRVRALVLLRRFLELGPRAVDVALCVGIFPYVLKLPSRRPRVATAISSNMGGHLGLTEVVGAT